MQTDAPPPAPTGRLFTLATALGAVAGVAALAMFLLRTRVREALEPIAARRFATGGVLDESDILLLDRIVGGAALAGVAAGVGLVGYGRIGAVFTRALPSRVTSAPTEPERTTRGQATFVVGAVVLCVVLALRHIGRGLSYDEIYTALRFVEVDSLWTTISTTVVFNNHVGYSVAAWISTHVLGATEWTLRLPALLLGAAVIPVAWRFARRECGPHVAALSVAFLALSPTLMLWSSSARGYTGSVLFALLSVHLYLGLLRVPDRRRAVAYVVVSALGAWCHLYTVWVVLAQAVHLLGLAVMSRRAVGGAAVSARVFGTLWRAFAATGVAVLLLHGPVLPRFALSLAARESGTFQPAAPLRVFAALSGTSVAVVQVLQFLLAATGWAALRRTRPRAASLFAILYALPFGVMWCLAPRDLYPRFFLFLLPLHAVLVSLGVESVGRALGQRVLAGRAVAVAVLGGPLVGLWLLGAWATPIPAGFREAAVALEQGAGPEVRQIGVGGGSELLEYYADGSVDLAGNLDAFHDLTRDALEVRCAVGRAATDGDREVVEYLESRADAEQHGVLRVFVYRR